MIQNLKLYIILNSSGSYALLVKLWTRGGVFQAKVPVGDATPEGIKRIRSVFSSMRPNYIGLDEQDWLAFDSFIGQINAKTDVHPSLSLALSIACARAATGNELWKIRGEGQWFPYIMGTVALGKDWKEFMLIPYRETSIMDAFISLKEAWKVTGDELREKNFLRGRTTGGTWLSDLTDMETLHFISQIAKDWRMRVGINIGASSLWDPASGTYRYKSKGTIIRKDMTTDEHMSLVSAVAEQYKVWYIEDPFHSGDIMSHAFLSHQLNDSLIAGSELYGADIDRIKDVTKLMSTKVIAVNPRNLSCISQMADISEFTRRRGLRLSLSRFETETEDHWLADLAIAFNADMLKIGIAGADNVSKFNRLLEIWDDAPSPRIGIGGQKTDLSFY